MAPFLFQFASSDKFSRLLSTSHQIKNHVFSLTYFLLSNQALISFDEISCSTSHMR
jgi:hypothetical protein